MTIHVSMGRHGRGERAVALRLGLGLGLGLGLCGVGVGCDGLEAARALAALQSERDVPGKHSTYGTCSKYGKYGECNGT